MHRRPAGPGVRRVADIEMLREKNGMDCLMIAPLGHESFIRFTEKVMPYFL